MATSQIKTGKSITVIQLIISVVVVLCGAVGLYVKNAVMMSRMDDRLTAIEKKMDKNETAAQVRVAARNAELREYDARIDKNTEDISILKVIKKDK